MNEIKRLGDVKKCPVCGSPADPAAYHCAKCRNYFCYHCRARVLSGDLQCQCTNLACDYFGKLICAACDPEVTKDEPPESYYEHEGGWWPQLMLGCFIIFLIALLIVQAGIAAAIAVGAFVIGMILLHRAGVNMVGRNRQIVQTKASIHHVCIYCAKPVRTIQ